MINVDRIQAQLRQFSAERKWDKYHSPKNLAMALSIESSELMEIFQWVSLEESRNVVNHPDKLNQVAEELADVCIYDYFKFYSFCV